jgi:hypothetical protein
MMEDYKILLLLLQLLLRCHCYWLHVRAMGAERLN